MFRAWMVAAHWTVAFQRFACFVYLGGCGEQAEYDGWTYRATRGSLNVYERKLPCRILGSMCLCQSKQLLCKDEDAINMRLLSSLDPAMRIAVKCLYSHGKSQQLLTRLQIHCGTLQ